jgi:hypothetical protein
MPCCVKIVLIVVLVIDRLQVIMSSAVHAGISVTITFSPKKRLIMEPPTILTFFESPEVLLYLLHM